jgi:hypothetical protein
MRKKQQSGSASHAFAPGRKASPEKQSETVNPVHNTVRSRGILAAHLFLAFCLSFPILTFAQAPAGAGTGTTSLPDSPQPKPQGSTNPAMDTTTRFIGYVTNRSIVFPDIATSEGPLSTGQKFRLFVNQSISPPYIIAPAISAAYDQARNSPKAYGQGWSAYGDRFGADLARAVSNSFFTSFLLASTLHQDPRFFPQSHPTIWSSVKYSVQRVFVTRTDSGRDTFNTSGILGTGMSEALANTYLPVSEQTLGKNAERIGVDLAWKVGANMFKNYWPTLFHSMGLNHLKVIPDPGSPNNSPPGSQVPR